jgi:hypothetical protein
VGWEFGEEGEKAQADGAKAATKTETLIHHRGARDTERGSHDLRQGRLTTEYWGCPEKDYGTTTPQPRMHANQRESPATEKKVVRWQKAEARHLAPQLDSTTQVPHISRLAQSLAGSRGPNSRLFASIRGCAPALAGQFRGRAESPKKGRQIPDCENVQYL